MMIPERGINMFAAHDFDTSDVPTVILAVCAVVWVIVYAIKQLRKGDSDGGAAPNATEVHVLAKTNTLLLQQLVKSEEAAALVRNGAASELHDHVLFSKLRSERVQDLAAAVKTTGEQVGELTIATRENVDLNKTLTTSVHALIGEIQKERDGR